MYKCTNEDCGCLFEEPKTYCEDRTSGGTCEGGSFIEYYLGCPMCSCGFEEIEEDEEELEEEMECD